MSALAPENIREDLIHQTHFFATIWKIKYRDGVTVKRFTDHDSTLTFEEVDDVFTDFVPVGGFNPSATEFELGLVEHNKEFKGPVDAVDADGNIVGPSFSDLVAGFLHEAEVSEWVVDWRHPWAGALALQKYWITDTEYDNEEFRASIEGLSRWTKPKIGSNYSRGCRHHLGRDEHGTISLTRGCRFDVSSVTELATVSSISVQRKQVIVTGLNTHADKYFDLGRMNWVTGANKGVIQFCSRSINSPRRMTFQHKTPKDITVGDSFEVEPGCDGTAVTCTSKFSNYINFGGQLQIPGNDKVLQVPK